LSQLELLEKAFQGASSDGKATENASFFVLDDYLKK
jgi:hypothetical protein